MPNRGTPIERFSRWVRNVPPSTALAISLVVLAIGAVTFVLTDSPQPPAPTASASHRATPSSAAPTSATPSPSPAPSASPSPDRSGVYVVVFNNTSAPNGGRATATAAENAGWNVVGTGDWHGQVDENTVYYPPNMEAQAQLLASDLGIKRTKPAFAPMQLDRLSVIITDGSGGPPAPPSAAPTPSPSPSKAAH